jgi:hypothetical protein
MPSTSLQVNQALDRQETGWYRARLKSLLPGSPTEVVKVRLLFGNQQRVYRAGFSRPYYPGEFEFDGKVAHLDQQDRGPSATISTS